MQFSNHAFSCMIQNCRLHFDMILSRLEEVGYKKFVYNGTDATRLLSSN